MVILEISIPGYRISSQLKSQEGGSRFGKEQLKEDCFE